MKKVATFPISAERGVLTTPNARPVELIAPKPLAILFQPGNDLPNQSAQKTTHNCGNMIARPAPHIFQNGTSALVALKHNNRCNFSGS